MYSRCAYLPMRQSGLHNAHAPSSPASSPHRETATVFEIRRILQQLERDKTHSISWLNDGAYNEGRQCKDERLVVHCN